MRNAEGQVTRREAIAILAASALGAGGKARERLPRIGLGTWQTFDVGPSETERKPLREVLAEFVKLGGRVVDSSPMYGRSEDVLGDLAVETGVRDKLFVATKSGRAAAPRASARWKSPSANCAAAST